MLGGRVVFQRERETRGREEGGPGERELEGEGGGVAAGSTAAMPHSPLVGCAAWLGCKWAHRGVRVVSGMERGTAGVMDATACTPILKNLTGALKVFDQMREPSLILYF